MHIPYCIYGCMCLSTAPRALGSCVLVSPLGYTLSFPVALRCMFPVQWELACLWPGG